MNFKFDIATKALETGEVDWDGIFKLFPILLKLEEVEQNLEYHAEGNVLNHTKMVVEMLVVNALAKNEVWRSENFSSVFLSALFHDIGKLETTKEENGVWSSNGHSAKGARMIRGLLWDYDKEGFKVPWEIRENVSTMALLHMLPIYFLEKADPLYSVCASSHTICNSELMMLSEADIKGRICLNASAVESIGMLGLFNDFCSENDCYWDAKEFKSNHARFLYFFERTGHPYLDRYFKRKGIVHLMSGLPGSGKDYYIDKNLDFPVVGLDIIREEMGVEPKEKEGQVHQEAKEQCKIHMRKGTEFVFNATNLLKQTRAKWIRLFRQYDYQVNIHYIEPSFQTILKQNSGRDRVVPESVIRAMFLKLEPPTLLECHELRKMV